MELTDEMQAQAKALADPSRFRIFRHIHEADSEVGVAELTELLGFNHNAIRQHLAVLTTAGLVAETTESRNVRGRPRKMYAVRADALNAFAQVTGAYERLAAMLLQLQTSGSDAYSVGFTEGSNTSPPDPDAVVGDLIRRLAADGFEPTPAADRSIVLGHCPFAEIAAQNPSVVCEMHRGLIDGFLSGASMGYKKRVVTSTASHCGLRCATGRAVMAGSDAKGPRRIGGPMYTCLP